jgi:hypothetical protein
MSYAFSRSFARNYALLEMWNRRFAWQTILHGMRRRASDLLSELRR